MPKRDDAWGGALLAIHAGRQRAAILIERDDGFIEPVPHEVLFAPPRAWPRFERAALRYARGRVLDVGCGAGRNALELQRRGHPVVAIDVSAKAVAVARARGVRSARVLALEDLSPGLGQFDTVLMLGNNLGLLGGVARGRRLLARLARATSDNARIIATTRDPYATTAPEHLWYHRRNRARGRMGGQIRMRTRYRKLVDPWFDYLFVSRAELRELLKGTGWKIARAFGTRQGYAVVIEKGRRRQPAGRPRGSSPRRPARRRRTPAR